MFESNIRTIKWLSDQIRANQQGYLFVGNELFQFMGRIAR